MVRFFMILLASWLTRKAGIHTSQAIILLIMSPSLGTTIWWDANYWMTFCTFGVVCSHPSSQSSVTVFLGAIHSRFWLSRQTIGQSPWIRTKSQKLPISPYKQSKQISNSKDFSLLLFYRYGTWERGFEKSIQKETIIAHPIPTRFRVYQRRRTQNECKIQMEEINVCSERICARQDITVAHMNPWCKSLVQDQASHGRGRGLWSSMHDTELLALSWRMQALRG